MYLYQNILYGREEMEKERKEKRLLTNAQEERHFSENLNSPNFYHKLPKNTRFSLSDSASSNSLWVATAKGGHNI